MSVSKAQQKAVSKYMKNNYDEIKVRTPKGRKAEIKAHADSQKESVNGFINRAIDETMERDKITLSNSIDKQKQSGSTRMPDFK